MICDRCRRETIGSTGSMFNTQQICLLVCAPAERSHPLYAEAVRAENEAVRRGDPNFPGIGLPLDLLVPERRREATT